MYVREPWEPACGWLYVLCSLLSVREPACGWLYVLCCMFYRAADRRFDGSPSGNYNLLLRQNIKIHRILNLTGRHRTIVRKQVVNALLITLVLVGLAIWIDFFPDSFKQVTGRDVQTRLGLDLQGGSQLFLRPRDGGISQEELEQAAGVIERRVNGIGVSEAVVQTSEDSIIVELPGIKDAAAASAALQGTGNLEFIDPRGEYLPEGTPLCTTNTPEYPPEPQVENTAVEAPSVEGDGGTPITPTTDLEGVAPLTDTTAPLTDVVVPGLETTEPATATLPVCTEADQYRTLATGTQLESTTINVTTDQRGQPAVFFRLTGEGADNIASFTAQNIGRYMTIVLDGRVISSPVINGALPGEGIITMGEGDRGQQQDAANSLMVQLKYGQLPVPLVEDSNRTISASLGGDSVRDSLVAGIIGLVMVMLFMLFYYRLPGLLADIALLIYAALALALFNLIPVTLTLPGIAGFILSIGLAVDANVLIFARIKEELRRGRSLERAVEDGFHHAWPSIRDSNAATLITCFILFFMGRSFGVSIIQGFALTLALGVLISLFTAIVVTRMLLRLTIDLGVTDPGRFGVHETNADLMQESSDTF